MSSFAGPTWDHYGAFLAVLESGSLSGASRALGLAQPTVRRQIEALEVALGAVLFTRAPNGLTPTELALSLRPHAEAIAQGAQALVRAATAPAEDERGTVRLTASEIVGAEVLPPMLARFAERHPGIQIELAPDDRSQDLLRREADVAVRMVAPTQKGLVQKRAGTIQLGLFAAPSYLGRRPAPTKLAELRGHGLVGPDRSRAMVAALAPLGLAPRDFTLRTDSTLAQLAAVRAGIGIGVCQVPLAARPLLVRVLPKVRFELPAWVVTHENLRRTRRVQRLFEHLVAELTAYAG